MIKLFNDSAGLLQWSSWKEVIQRFGFREKWLGRNLGFKFNKGGFVFGYYFSLLCYIWFNNPFLLLYICCLYLIPQTTSHWNYCCCCSAVIIVTMFKICWYEFCMGCGWDISGFFFMKIVVVVEEIVVLDNEVSCILWFFFPFIFI